MPASSLPDKVTAYITAGRRLLVFRHTGFPAAGLQVPAGTIDRGESPHAAVMREAQEETGLDSLHLRRYLGARREDLAAYGDEGILLRHFFHLELEGEVAETWRHFERNPSGGAPAPIEFEFTWFDLEAGMPGLAGIQGALLPALRAALEDAGSEGESALVVLVPEAESLVDSLRAQHDYSARVGVPAHITLLYPFAPPTAIDAAMREALRALFAARSPFPYQFARPARFPDVFYLAPEPAATFSALIQALSARFPQHPPYEGQIPLADIVPHLTVADGYTGAPLDEIEDVFRRKHAGALPLPARAGEIWLLEKQRGWWRRTWSFALGERNPQTYCLRPLQTADQAFLWDMLRQAIHVSAGDPPPLPDLLTHPELARYAQDWGRPGDLGFVAVAEAGRRLGAAWLRLMAGRERGYGWVDDNTPELSLAVTPPARGLGIGAALLHALLWEARLLYRGVSLSVSSANPARPLYERAGFATVDASGGAITMLRRWTPADEGEV